MKTLVSLALAAVLVFVTILVGALVLTPFTWFAWNGAMPEIFGLPEIGFWTAFSLNLLSGMLLRPASSNK